ncbi:LPXTG cell wall anchor domain-containing protein [Streptacidiphilus sp. ASG 303]|uniref:LPXTG cell wall anchor domain-containing protein n=1 Tax=Streptacidiphilus sp. ASG 303 TaxID=2896847 RepID=UPI001E61C3B5|nr:LPXTG cell wall anchor domain-containing protein [Streptacidiphilus sp. ASG 303]MCD0485922.1 LPXTG cell wall anchor domain-containing protein [Streptacidiphilus sp. ASG 303]
MSSRRHARFAAASALTVLASFAGAASGAAPAAASTPECGSAKVEYRALDGQGSPVEGWTSAGGFHGWKDAPTAVQVRLAAGQQIGEGCRYPVSLSLYSTEGPNWGNSGRQAYLGSDTVYLTADDVAAEDGSGDGDKLTVQASFDSTCYGQIDLYGNDTVYDGGTAPGHGPLPYQPGGVVTPYDLIAAWNGGTKGCTETTPPPNSSAPESTPPASDSPSPSASVSSPQPSAPESSAPPASDSPSPSATPSSPQPSSSQGGGLPTTNPTVSPAPPTSAAPSPSSTGPGLAETGAGDTLGLAAGGAAVVLVGGAALVLTRRRSGRRS